MKKLSKSISLLLCVVVLISSTISVSAAENYQVVDNVSSAQRQKTLVDE